MSQIDIKKIIDIKTTIRPPKTIVRGFGNALLLSPTGDETEEGKNKIEHVKIAGFEELQEKFSAESEVHQKGLVYFGAWEDTPSALTVVQYGSELSAQDALKYAFSEVKDWYILLLEKDIETPQNITTLGHLIEAEKKHLLFAHFHPSPQTITPPEQFRIFQKEVHRVCKDVYEKEGKGKGDKTLGKKKTVRVEEEIDHSYTFGRTALFYDNEAKLAVAMASRLAIVDLSLPDSATNYAFKTPSLVTPSELTTSKSDELDEFCINYFANIMGQDITYKGLMLDGSSIAQRQQIDYVKASYEMALFDLFRREKNLGFDQRGYAYLFSTLDFTSRSFVRSGIIATGTVRGQTIEDGYKLLIPNFSKLGDEEKKTGVLKGVQVILVLSGSIKKIIMEMEV